MTIISYDILCKLTISSDGIQIEHEISACNTSHQRIPNVVAKCDHLASWIVSHRGHTLKKLSIPLIKSEKHNAKYQTTSVPFRLFLLGVTTLQRGCIQCTQIPMQHRYGYGYEIWTQHDQDTQRNFSKNLDTYKSGTR